MQEKAGLMEAIGMIYCWLSAETTNTCRKEYGRQRVEDRKSTWTLGDKGGGKSHEDKVKRMREVGATNG